LEQAKFIQDESIFVLIGIELFLLALIYWFYRNYWKVRERDYDNSADNYSYGYNRMFSWRLYVIVGVVFIIISLELIKRLIHNLN
jgi:hypothetical protein